MCGENSLGNSQVGGPGPPWGVTAERNPPPRGQGLHRQQCQLVGQVPGTPGNGRRVNGGEQGLGSEWGPRSPWWLRTVRQPMQQLWRLVKARRPPTLPVSTVLHRVWSPPAGRGEDGHELLPSPSSLDTPSRPGRPRTQQHGLGAALAQDGLEDAQERLGELLLQVVLRVDGQAVLQHEQGVLRAERQNGPIWGRGLWSTTGCGVKSTRSHGASGHEWDHGNRAVTGPRAALWGMASTGRRGSGNGVRSHGGSLAMDSVNHAGVHRWGPQVTKEGPSS